jgi:hypothetical protein
MNTGREVSQIWHRPDDIALANVHAEQFHVDIEFAGKKF